MRRAAILVVFATLSACTARATTPAVPAAVPVAASVTASQPASPPRLPNDLKWVRDSAEFHAAVLQTYRLATARVEQQASGRAPGSWAVILDADETVINNLQYQMERARIGQGFSQETWTAWVRRREATPLPGASAFLARVRALGGRIAIVTNRLAAAECPDTEALFRARGLVYDVMLCRPEGQPSDKNPRFEAVMRGAAFGLAQAVDVVAWIGDNIHDFPLLSQESRKQGEAAFADFGVRFFLVPNPMYGGWQ